MISFALILKTDSQIKEGILICTSVYQGTKKWHQMVTLHEYGIEDRQIYMDKQSGKNFDRPNYQKFMRKLKNSNQSLNTYKKAFCTSIKAEIYNNGNTHIPPPFQTLSKYVDFPHLE